MMYTYVSKAARAAHDAPVVLVHGSWGSSAMWKNYTGFFSENGWNVYAPDLRGHGKSGGEVKGATMEDYVSDVRRAVSEHGLAGPIVIGHSMGALVALMYARDHGARAVVAIDPSPSREVQGGGEKKEYPAVYTPKEAGMPTNPFKAMRALPDIGIMAMMRMKRMLGTESGVARSERKLGISVPKEKLPMPVLFVGGELGESLPFGIGIRTARAMADYYGKDVIEIKRATHPGILIGKHAMEAAEQIGDWLSRQ